jgi:hypothetical protein
VGEGLVIIIEIDPEGYVKEKDRFRQEEAKVIIGAGALVWLRISILSSWVMLPRPKYE